MSIEEAGVRGEAEAPDEETVGPGLLLPEPVALEDPSACEYM